MSERLLTPKQAGEQIGVTEWTIRRMVKRGELRGEKLRAVTNAKAPDGVLRIPESALAEIREAAA